MGQGIYAPNIFAAGHVRLQHWPLSSALIPENFDCNRNEVLLHTPFKFIHASVIFNSKHDWYAHKDLFVGPSTLEKLIHPANLNNARVAAFGWALDCAFAESSKGRPCILKSTACPYAMVLPAMLDGNTVRYAAGVPPLSFVFANHNPSASNARFSFALCQC